MKDGTFSTESYVPNIQVYIMDIGTSVTGGTLNLSNEAFKALKHEQREQEHKNGTNQKTTQNILTIYITLKSVHDKVAPIINVLLDI